MQQTGRGIQLSSQEQHFLGLAEQLSRPLLQISRMSELATSGSATVDLWPAVQAIAGASLQLVESYALSLRLHGQLKSLELEPVTVSSLLYEAAQSLQPFAQQYGVELQLDTGPRLAPVLGDRVLLHSVLMSLGQVFVMAGAETAEEGIQPIRLAAHRSRYGIVTGLYGASQQLGADSLRRAHALQGKARQPLQRFVSGPAAGVFVADSLLQTMSARLHVARYRKLTGLATILAPSQQLQLI